MKQKILALALGLLFTMPFTLQAEEVEITLVEVVEMGTLPGDNPLDGDDHLGSTPTRPNDFRASRNGNNLSVNKQNESIPSAQVIVTKASTGNVVINQSITSSLSHQITTAGLYIIRIQTANGALIGQFMVP